MNIPITWIFLQGTRPVIKATCRVPNIEYNNLIIRDSYSGAERLQCRHVCRGNHVKQKLLKTGISEDDIVTMWSAIHWEEPDDIVIDIFAILKNYDDFVMAKMILS